MLKSHRKTIFEILGRNPIHPFPARMAPGIALDALAKRGTQLRVLDPMAGSGTVLAVARAKGHRAFGVDLDPLAVLLAQVWTQAVHADEVNTKAVDVLNRAKIVFSGLRQGRAYPSGCDAETRKFIRYWFDPYARRQLTSLAVAIGRVRKRATRDVLWCAFSRLIITKQAGASLAMDLSHSRPHKKFKLAPVKPFAQFIQSVEKVVENCPQVGRSKIGPMTVVKHGDARELAFDDGSIDMVLTSPPYLNAIDYIRCSKFSLVWMGYGTPYLRGVRTNSIGTETSTKEAKTDRGVEITIENLRLQPKLTPRDEALLSQYIWDIGRALAEVARVLRVNGRAVYVVGDSTIRGTFIQNSAIVTAAAEAHGLSLRSRHDRELPANRRYLPPPKLGATDALLDARMRKEVVLVFDKLARKSDRSSPRERRVAQVGSAGARASR